MAAPRRLGTIRARGPGVWQITADAGPDPLTGRRRRLYRTVHGTRRDAEHALADLAADLRAGRAAPGAGLTFGQHLDQWAATMTAQRWSGATAVRVRQDIRTHLAGLARRRLRDLTPADFDQLYAAMTARGLSPRTVQSVHGTARAALNHAVKQGHITRNPTVAATVPVNRKVRRTMPTAGDLDQVITHAVDTGDGMWAVWFRVAFYTGARPAEVCALRWSDIDLDRAEIHYRRAIGRTADGRWAVKGTKTHAEHRDGERTVAIDLATAAALRRWRAVMTARLLQVGQRAAGRSYVFGRDPLGERPMSPDTPSKRWRDHARAVGVPDGVRLYDAARHHHISFCLALGFPVADIAQRVGNSPEIIYRTYAHVLQTNTRAIADAIDQARPGR